MTPDAWPDRDIRVTAVRADTGELRVFTRRDQVPLATAVAASGALPFVRRPVEVDGVWYVDGSIRSTTNADLATGASHVVVLAPVPRSRGRRHGIAVQLRGLGPEVGAAAVAPDRRTLRTVGERHFDPRRCPRAARAGYLQAPTQADVASALDAAAAVAVLQAITIAFAPLSMRNRVRMRERS